MNVSFLTSEEKIPTNEDVEYIKELCSQAQSAMYSVFFSDLVEFLDYDIPRFYYLNEEQRKQLLKAKKDLFKKKIPILQFFKYYYHMSLPKRVNTFVNTDPTYKEFKEHIKNLKSFMKNKYGLILNFN